MGSTGGGWSESPEDRLNGGSQSLLFPGPSADPPEAEPLAQRLQPYINETPGHKSKQFLVSLFPFLDCLATVEYRKTNGELGREELRFQLGVMGQSSCTRVYLFSLSVVRGGNTGQLELGRQNRGLWGRNSLLTSSLSLTEEPRP